MSNRKQGDGGEYTRETLPTVGGELGRQVPNLLDEHRRWQAQLASRQLPVTNSEAAAMLGAAPGGSQFGIDSRAAANGRSHPQEKADRRSDRPDLATSPKGPDLNNERSVSFVATTTDKATAELLEDAKNLPNNTTVPVDSMKSMFERLGSMRPGSVDQLNIMGHGTGAGNEVIMSNLAAGNLKADALRNLDPELVRRAAASLAPGARINILACQTGNNRELCQAIADSLLPKGGTVTASLTNAVPFGPTAKRDAAFSEGPLKFPRNAFNAYVNGDATAVGLWGPRAPVPGSNVRGSWITYRKYPGNSQIIVDRNPQVLQG